MVVLKGIPAIISPDLLDVLARMGHGDEIVLGDAHFPTSSICTHGPREVRADGHSIPALLDAILSLLPLDAYVDSPARTMQVVPSDIDEGVKTPVWEEYQRILNKHSGKHVTMGTIERFAFYETAKKAYAVVATGEEAIYGNIILTKGNTSS
ncbi:fucose mutarotase-like [Diadema antillarum]|uniref:fucose mutarotase-like n=1 Tax=Diadema antillarum TaxID=105358 RepID=UPI003A8511FC